MNPLEGLSSAALKYGAAGERTNPIMASTTNHLPPRVEPTIGHAGRVRISEEMRAGGYEEADRRPLLLLAHTHSSLGVRPIHRHWL